MAGIIGMVLGSERKKRMLFFYPSFLPAEKGPSMDSPFSAGVDIILNKFAGRPRAVRT
jgi:hypothetical protein